MEKIRELLKNPYGSAAVAFVIGALFGLIVLGWGIFPVNWVDASPQNLRSDLQQEYLKMAIQSFAANNDIQAAQEHWSQLGPGAANLVTQIQDSGTIPENQIQGFLVAVNSPIVAVPTTAANTQAPGGTALSASATPYPAAAGTTNLLIPLLLLCLLLLVIVGALAYVFLVRGRRPATKAPVSPVMQAQEITRQAEKTNFATKGQEAPVAQFMTTYMAGDDLYDDSFSIDSPAGEFLGECGVGISETIGVGDPKKVTAFEVWLFDKNDIQTVTKVLMSPHAFDDPSIHQRLESKGEPVLTEPGKTLLLETATLQLEARIVDMNYGKGAMPDNSYFDRLTLELAIWTKVAV